MGLHWLNSVTLPTLSHITSSKKLFPLTQGLEVSTLQAEKLTTLQGSLAPPFC